MVGSCRPARILLESSREEIWKAIHLYWAQYVRECLLVAFMWDIWLSTFRRSSFINGCLNLCEYEYIVPIAEMLLTSLCRQIKPVTKTQAVLGNSFSFETQQAFIKAKLQVQPFQWPVENSRQSLDGDPEQMGSLPAFQSRNHPHLPLKQVWKDAQDGNLSGNYTVAPFQMAL